MECLIENFVQFRFECMCSCATWVWENVTFRFFTCVVIMRSKTQLNVQLQAIEIDKNIQKLMLCIHLKGACDVPFERKGQTTASNTSNRVMCFLQTLWAFFVLKHISYSMNFYNIKNSGFNFTGKTHSLLATCTLCEKDFKYDTSSKTNLYPHLSKIHPEERHFEISAK